jgi:hypothetical protein
MREKAGDNTCPLRNLGRIPLTLLTGLKDGTMMTHFD